MRRYTPLSLSIILIALLLASSLAACGGETSPAGVEPAPAPAAELVELEGGEVVPFPDHWEGRAVAVSFFSPG
ncbi:MAG: hypothetical protein ACOCVQ_00915 [Bacillota bacterium]